MEDRDRRGMKTEKFPRSREDHQSLRWTMMRNLSSDRIVMPALVAGGFMAAAVFLAVGAVFSVPDATGNSSPLSVYLFLGVLSGLLIATGLMRIELRDDALCIVNLATVTTIGRTAIRAVRPSPQLTILTVQGSEATSTLFSPSLGARIVTNYARWRAAANQIEIWRSSTTVDGTPSPVSTRPRWELGAYVAVLVGVQLATKLVVQAVH